MGAPVLEARGLGKAWRTWDSRADRVLEVCSLGALRRHREHWALRDLDLELPAGEALGVVGSNGAGKSTLLKLLAGATRPSAGCYRTRGRVAGILELGAGFHPDFSGVENALLTGVLHGRTRREMRARLGRILEFAQLEDVAHAPLKSYSTGMAMRLGFATALGIDPEVLILDEVLAVGDRAFQKRCVDALLAFRAGGGSLLLVSHSLYDVRQMCERALWLRDGRVAGLGDAARVTAAYSAWHDAREAARAADADPEPGLPRLTGVELVAPGHGPGPVADEGADGEAARGPLVLDSGRDLAVRVAWTNPTDAPLHLGITLTRQDRTLVAASATHVDGLLLEGPAGCATLHLPELALLAGRFTVVAHLLDASGLHRHHERPTARDLVVDSGTRELGLVRLAHRWELEGPDALAVPATAVPAARRHDDPGARPHDDPAGREVAA